MNCKECIHNEVCYCYKVTYTDNNPICCYFKDKSRFVELPCNGGTGGDQMKRIYTYPCSECKRKHSCHYEKCGQFMKWFRQEWQIIRRVAETVREKEREKNGE